MTNQEKFDRTVSILVQAYLNDTLEKGNCQACAVGNLIAHSTGATYERVRDIFHGHRETTLEATPKVPNWLQAICTSDGDGDYQHSSESVYLNSPEIKKAFDGTGYSFNQLARIEFAFESNNAGISATDSENEFAGLMGVVEELALIHGLDLQTAAEAKTLFVHA